MLGISITEHILRKTLHVLWKEVHLRLLVKG